MHHVIYDETLLAHLCRMLLCPPDCSVQHGTDRVRGDSHPNWVPPPHSQPIYLSSMMVNALQYCCDIIMQWSLVLPCYSPSKILPPMG